MLGFVHGHYLFQEANRETDWELRGTDNVQGQTSEHIFASNGGYCVFILQTFFATRAVLKIWEYLTIIP